jgi:hypothetical protein
LPGRWDSSAGGARARGRRWASKALKQVIWNQAFAFAEPWYVKLVPHPAAVLDD